MEQNEFILKVQLVEELEHYIQEDFGDAKISITAWDVDSKFMIDQHITFWYPQLNQMGIEELQEGDMCYYGEMTIDELIKALDEWGFIVEGSDKHMKVLGGEKIETKIKPFSNEDYETYNQEEKFKIHESTERLIAQLEKNLQRAINEENFEEAAQIRDEIKFLSNA